jgi:TIR domain-containing protein
LRLSQELRLQGIHPWVDVEQVPPGRSFQDVIQSAVRTVKTAAIIIGGAGLGRWQALELRTFMNRCVEQGIPLIPVLLPGVTVIPDGLEFLRELNHVKFGEDVTEEGLSRLVWGITGERP